MKPQETVAVAPLIVLVDSSARRRRSVSDSLIMLVDSSARGRRSVSDSLTAETRVQEIAPPDPWAAGARDDAVLDCVLFDDLRSIERDTRTMLRGMFNLRGYAPEGDTVSSIVCRADRTLARVEALTAALDVP